MDPWRGLQSRCMSQVIAWLVVAIVAAVVEIFSPLFGFIFASAAALLAGGAARMGVPLPGQVGIFAGVLFLGVLLLRPWVLSRRASPGVPSRTDRLVGLAGVVTQAIDPESGAGRVLVDGQDWAAKAPDRLSEGVAVVVNGADGIVLTVASSE